MLAAGVCARHSAGGDGFEGLLEDAYPAADTQEFLPGGGRVAFLLFGLSPFSHCLTHQERLRNGLLFKSLGYLHLPKYKC